VTGRRIGYLTTLPFDWAWLDELRHRAPDVDVRQRVVASPEEIDDAEWAEVDVLHTGAVLPRPELTPRLRWLQLDTSGAEHVAATPWWDADVEITTLGGVAPVPMAEFTVMQLLALAHHQPLLDEVRRTRRWPDGDHRFATMTPLPVDGATATIVGYGRIGREIARLLRALGMHVVGISRRGSRADAERPARDQYFDTGRQHESDPTEHRSVAELPEVLARTDFLVVVTPRTAETEGMIGATELALLPRGACLVNVSRGGICEEKAVLDALDTGHLTYAATDVFDEEPLAPDSVWWEHPRVVITPHVAGLAPRYHEQVLELVSTNLARLRDGLELLNRVDRATGY
jgi:phosphoglycerate dehydrogenase-like enzyme